MDWHHRVEGVDEREKVLLGSRKNPPNNAMMLSCLLMYYGAVNNLSLCHCWFGQSGSLQEDGNVD